MILLLRSCCTFPDAEEAVWSQNTAQCPGTAAAGGLGLPSLIIPGSHDSSVALRTP